MRSELINALKGNPRNSLRQVASAAATEIANSRQSAADRGPVELESVAAGGASTTDG